MASGIAPAGCRMDFLEGGSKWEKELWTANRLVEELS
jgi:hypothetical protein